MKVLRQFSRLVGHGSACHWRPMVPRCNLRYTDSYSWTRKSAVSSQIQRGNCSEMIWSLGALVTSCGLLNGDRGIGWESELNRH